MSDALLTVQQQEEALSRVYVRAVASRAGYVASCPTPDVDGVDLQISAGGAMRPKLDLQLKATISLGSAKDGCFHFPLKRRNYNLLRIDTQTPRLLVLLDLPRNQDEWMTLTSDNLILRRSAYWISLYGEQETTNRSSVTVDVPQRNLFDVRALRALMDKSRNGHTQ